MAIKKSVIKKTGLVEEWNTTKIKNAVNKSAQRINTKVSSSEFEDLYKNIEEKIVSEVSVNDLHNIVEQSLREIGREDVADTYSSYRNYKQDFADLIQSLHAKAQSAIVYGDRENANFESSLISTQQSLIRGYLTKELYKLNYLTKAEREAIEDGYIYIHDLRDLIFNSINCCLWDMEAVLNGGFEMANIKYTEPTSVLSALQLIGDIALASSAQAYGGYTLPEIDKTLVKYARKTIKKAEEEVIEYGIPAVIAHKYINDRLSKELRQGFQSIEMKLNSVPSSRGDFAFTTFTFGNLDNPEDEEIQAKICHTILENRMTDNPVVFPKLVMLFSWEQNQKSTIQQELFDKCIECSCKALYPDYLPIDTVGQVSDYYRASGKVVSPMGCRAYLSDFKDENGESFFVGRSNIGASSLNLAMIYMKAKEENKDFYKVLDYYLEMIRGFLLRRYEAVSNSRASTNPLAFTQGGMRGGNLKPTDKIGEITRSYTASFGITALNELNILLEGKPLHESDKVKVNEVVDHIINKINIYKQEDNRLYAGYGVPAESLAGTQVQQFRAKYGIVEGVSDKEYFSNSFHCHVSAEISPFTKQDHEYELYHKINGGHIQYTRLDVSKPNVVKGVVLRGMSMGFYSGVNANKAFCDDCGWSGNESVDECPACHSESIMEINRVCGYLGYSKQKGATRFNDSKIAELKDRVSM